MDGGSLSDKISSLSKGKKEKRNINKYDLLINRKEGSREENKKLLNVVRFELMRFMFQEEFIYTIVLLRSFSAK